MATYRPYPPHEHEWGAWDIYYVCIGERPDGSWGAMHIRFCLRCNRSDKRAVE